MESTIFLYGDQGGRKLVRRGRFDNHCWLPDNNDDDDDDDDDDDVWDI